MDWLDIFKIVVPIITSLIVTMVAMVLWIFRREEQTKAAQDSATKEYWQTVHKALESMITELSGRLTAYNQRADDDKKELHARVASVEKQFYDFKEHVAGEYLKRELWGSNHQNLERKIDNIRTDFGKELRAISDKLERWRNEPKRS